MAHTDVSDELWEEFHAAVNMTSAELESWLRESDAGERPTGSEPLPDQAGPAPGRHVLAILRKRRGDLTTEDAEVMAAVVDRALKVLMSIGLTLVLSLMVFGITNDLFCP